LINYARDYVKGTWKRRYFFSWSCES